MDDVRPDNLNPEELLSAYLDGEVTADERAQVEQMLAADPEMRAALEELRALSAALKSLPKLSVGEDLSERVLRRAERAMLERQTAESSEAPVAAQQVSPAAKSAPSPAASVEKSPTIVERGTHGAGWARRLAWPLAAIAATLLIMLVTQKQKPELALAPVDSAPHAPRASRSPEAVVHSAPNDAAPDEAAPDEEAWEADPEMEEDFRAGKGSRPGAEGKSYGAARDHDAFSDSPAPRAEQEFRGANEAGESQLESSAVHSKMKGAPSSAKDAGDSPRRFGKAMERQAQGEPQPALAKAEQERGSAAPAVPGEAAGSPIPGAALSNAPSADAMRARGQAPGSNARLDLVVEVLAADDAVAEVQFDDLLVRQNIRVEDFNTARQRKQLAQDLRAPDGESTKDREAENLAENGLPAEAGADKKASSQTKPGSGNQQQKLAELKGKKPANTTDLNAELPAAKPADEAGDKSGQDVENFGDAGRAAAQAADVELVLVTATPGEVRNLLKEMESRSSQYRALSLELAPSGQLAEDRPIKEQNKRNAQRESLGANRANKPAPAKTPPAPAGEAKPQAHRDTSGSYAFRWQVSEEQLASLVRQDAFDEQTRGREWYWLDAETAGKLAEGIARAEERGQSETLNRKRDRSELADASADAILPSETAEAAAKKGTSKKGTVEKAPTASKTEAQQSATPSAAQGGGKQPKSPAEKDSQLEKSQNQPSETDGVETPASRPTTDKRDDAFFDEKLGVDRLRRARLEEQLRGTAENEQIRVLFVLRGGMAANRQSVSTPAASPNTAEPAPAAESAPAEAAPAKE